MSRFQLIFTGILIALGVVGALVFALSKSSSSQSAPQVVMWGSIPSQTVTDFLSKAMQDYRDTVNVSYVQKDAATLESDLIAALARGQGPDMILLPQDLIVKQLDKFYPVPFSTYSERAFKDSFIQEGELYLTPAGIIGFPFSVDPLVMYWNRDMFSDAGVATPPSAWGQFFTLAPAITKKDANGNILQSAIAFGEARNVVHFKDTLALLSLQAGTPIVGRDATSGALKSFFGTPGQTGTPGDQALAYYTEFSNPLKASYSWNRSLPTDRSDFIAGKLAVYFGYASELSGIRAANPNLNFDVAMVPQTEGKKATFGAMNAIALLRSSKNLAAAYIAAGTLTDAALQAEWVSETGYPPVRRDLLTTLPGDAYRAVFYKSALISAAWLDPNREATVGVFGRLVEDVTSGKLLVSESVQNASQQLDALLR